MNRLCFSFNFEVNSKYIFFSDINIILLLSNKSVRIENVKRSYRIVTSSINLKAKI